MEDGYQGHRCVIDTYYVLCSPTSCIKLTLDNHSTSILDAKFADLSYDIRQCSDFCNVTTFANAQTSATSATLRLHNHPNIADPLRPSYISGRPGHSQPVTISRSSSEAVMGLRIKHSRSLRWLLGDCAQKGLYNVVFVVIRHTYLTITATGQRCNLYDAWWKVCRQKVGYPEVSFKARFTSASRTGILFHPIFMCLPPTLRQRTTFCRINPASQCHRSNPKVK